VAEARRTLGTAYALLDDRLARHDWAAGPAFALADCATAPALFYTRAVHRWDEAGHDNITRYYRDLMARPSVTRVVDEARPLPRALSLPWPADMDDLGPLAP
jgi:glutathione S-transferase